MAIVTGAHNTILTSSRGESLHNLHKEELSVSQAERDIHHCFESEHQPSRDPSWSYLYLHLHSNIFEFLNFLTAFNNTSISGIHTQYWLMLVEFDCMSPQNTQINLWLQMKTSE